MGSATLRSNNYSNVHLQVRVGNFQNAEQNTLVFDQSVPQGWSQQFQFPVVLFFRRNGNPDNPQSPFTSWISPYDGEDIDICS